MSDPTCSADLAALLSTVRGQLLPAPVRQLLVRVAAQIDALSCRVAELEARQPPTPKD